ncbi:MAG: glycosyltransferase family 2 protein, partial [Pseudomonadota bacterium]
PPWMEQASPHSQYPLPAPKELVTGYTGNCLMDLTHPAFAGRRFDESFGRRHGSDDVYFSAAHRAGASFGRAEAAFVYEPVLPERLSFQWLLKRRYHYGQAHACISQRARGWLATSAAAKASYCAGTAALSVFSPTQYRKALLRGALHLGVMAGALGTPAEEVYGTP